MPRSLGDSFIHVSRLTHVVEIDEHTHRATRYGGGWAGYQEERATASRHARERYDVPVVEVILPAARRAAAATGRPMRSAIAGAPVGAISPAARAGSAARG